MDLVRRLLAAIDEAVAPAWRMRRQFRRRPLIALGSLEEGMIARVSGAVRKHERLLVAPLSRRPCVYYAVTVLGVTEASQRATTRELGSEQAAVEFQLADESGVALVDPAVARVSATNDCESGSRALFDADATQREIFARLRPGRTDWFLIQRLRFCESIIAPGQHLTLLGGAMREPVPPSADADLYRTSSGTRLRFTGTRAYPLLFSDDPRVAIP